MPKNIVLFANHNNGYEITQYLLKRKDSNILKIVVLPDRKNQWHRSVRQLAVKNKLSCIVYTDTSALLKKLRNLDVDLIISANWRYKLAPEVLGLAKMGAVNYHNSLLPKYRGAYANAWAIEKGETKAGVTLHWMSPKFDDGDVIAQRTVPILPTDTSRELWERLNSTFLKLFKQLWPKLSSWKKLSRKQRISAPFYSVSDYQKTNEINLNKTTTPRELINKLRARTFLPYYNGAYFIDSKTKKKIFVTIALKVES